jgi:DNA-binding MarR family transcriptional regulator
MAVVTIEDCVANRSPGRLLRRIDKLMWHLIEDNFADADLSFIQWIALKLVRDGTVTNAGELARDIDITTGATTRVIDALEERGFVERDRSAEDRRVVRLKITDAGQAKLMETAPYMVDSWNVMLADFEQSEVDQMVRLLAKLLDTIERRLGKESRRPYEEAAE